MIIAFALFWMPLASIGYMYQPEILPANGVNLVTFVNNLAFLGVTFSFLFLSNSTIGLSGTFVIYAICCLAVNYYNNSSV